MGYDLHEVSNELRAMVPGALRCVISTAASDLYSGPVYLDRWGGEACFGDDVEGLHQFDFSRAVELIGNWLDSLPTYYYEDWSGCLVTREDVIDGWEDDGETLIELDRGTVAECVCGTELARYV